MLKALFVLTFGLFWLAGAEARESNPVATLHATVTLVSEVDNFEPGEPFRIGLRFKLAKGWHIYWLNPGDAGEPPRLELTLPPGAAASEIDWPAPFRIPEGPVMTYSYSDAVTLPVTVTPPASAAPFTIEAKATWLICEKICVPEEGRLLLDMPSGSPSPSAEAGLFAAADERIPRPSPYSAELSPDATIIVSGADISPDSVKEVSFFPAKWGGIDDAASQRLSVDHGSFALSLTPAQTFDPQSPLSGVLRIADADGAERFLSIVAAPAETIRTANNQNLALAPIARSDAAAIVQTNADIGVAGMLFFAFLGGVILNLMPCVFPILAIKAISIAKLSGHERKHVRRQAAAYTAGVLLSFAALGTLLLLLKAAGAAVGWGFQFQSPVFVAAMAFVFLLLGLNLSGVFEFGGRFVGIGDSLVARSGIVGSFFTGFLAVLVATPCTAPFMGTAVAASLAISPLATLAVLLAVGFGLATPYVLLAFIPGLASLLPKPGAWMAILKQALAFPMYASTAWLVWVLSQQAGPDGVAATMAGLVLVGLAAWAIGATQGGLERARWSGWAIAGLAVFGVCAILYTLAGAPSSPAAADKDEQTYSPARLAALRADGRAVFINLTAAWCVTCKINERVALTSTAVREAFAARHIAYLKGDWTRADPIISDLLREHGRDGVPLYLFYPSQGRKPIVLPQLLTAGVVLDELDRAGS